MKLSKGLQGKEDKVNNLIVKSLSKIKDLEMSDFKFFREYQEALMMYSDKVLEKIVEGISIDVGINPNDLKKSVRVPIDTLIKVISGDEEADSLAIMHKSLFDKLRGNYKWTDSMLRKFKWNDGKPLEPISFNGLIKYNPDTKKPMTKQEWNKLLKKVTKYLKDKLGSQGDELVIRSGLMGKFIKQMEKDGIKLSQIKKKSWDDIVERFGDIPNTFTKAQKIFSYTNDESRAVKFAQQDVGRHLSIDTGDVKTSIVNSVQDVISQGLENGDTPGAMVSRFYHIDEDDGLSAGVKGSGLDDWKRDWRRVVLTETKAAKENGYLNSNSADREKGEKLYFVFNGSYSETDGPGQSCNKYLGEIVLLVDEPRSNDVIKDPYAKYCIWSGKNNIGRKKRDHWVCIPMHPHCKHFWTKIDPTIQEWDDEVNAIMFREDI